MKLAWYQSLETKLGLVFLLLLALLITGAYFANRVLVRDGLLDEGQRYESEVASREAQTLNVLAQSVRIFASTAAQMASVGLASRESLDPILPALAQHPPFDGAVSAFGLWLEPGAGTSTLWLTDGKRHFIPHQEMNQPPSQAYSRMAWYNIGRYQAADTCYWTGLREEPISKAQVLSCVMPIVSKGTFAGVVTVSISADTLLDRLNAIQRDHNGYLFLLDDDHRLLAVSGNAEASFGTAGNAARLSDLAKAHGEYQTLDTTLKKQEENAAATVVKSSRYKASDVSALRDASSGISRDQAEAMLIRVWGQRRSDDLAAEPTRISLPQDAVLKQASNAAVYASPEGAWNLVRVTATASSFEGVSYVFTQALVVTMVLVTLTLLVVYYALRAVVILPLRSFARQLENSTSVEDAINVPLDESARNEVGLLAHWQNERVRQLADALSATRSAKTQLSTESGERKQLQEQLARSQERATLALQSVTDAVVVTDEFGNIEGFNPAAEAITGVNIRHARGRPFDEVVKTQGGDVSNASANLARLVISRGSRIDYNDEIVLTAANGQSHEIALSAAPMQAHGRIAGAVVVFRERGARQPAAITLASEELSPSNRDGITGLSTRAACEHRIDALIEQSRQTGNTSALIYLDVDNLKRINDAGGQAAGDDVLVRTAETLAGIAPQSQQVFRLSADQFAVVASDLSVTAGVTLAEQLRERLASTRFYWESRHFAVTGSFGVAVIDKSLPNAMEAVRRADDACAAAKRAGRNCVRLYDPSMDRADRRVDDEIWVRCIRRGLSENLFHLRTQWIMPSSENAAEGHAFEVLLALEDDEGFWASPAAFMPVAERHHLMGEIDRWVISSALSHLESHPQTLKSLAFCSINLSAMSLTDPNFLEFMVEQLADRVDLAPKLCFELRELTLVEHPNEALVCCDALHKMGCKVSVDHYLGRYMSDLIVLRRLPVDHVKVDALSYKNLSSDPVEQMLAESTFRIARHLRRRVIVTGIEDVRAQETWRKLGANYFQGFAFAKPSPVIFLPPE